MVTAIRMPDDVQAALISEMQADPATWQRLKEREANLVNEDGSLKEPLIYTLIDDVVKAKHGHDHLYIIGPLVIEVRRLLRIELGLPTS